jgi:peroxiredoxin
VQLQNAKQRFEAQGIRIAAASYDSPAILADFAKRQNLEYPLLADLDSKVIRSFNVLNAEAKGMTKGMAHPDFFISTRAVPIREKYFEAKYTNRFTETLLVRSFFPN